MPLRQPTDFVVTERGDRVALSSVRTRANINTPKQGNWREVLGAYLQKGLNDLLAPNRLHAKLYGLRKLA